jgi:hypothetical protein
MGSKKIETDMLWFGYVSMRMPGGGQGIFDFHTTPDGSITTCTLSRGGGVVSMGLARLAPGDEPGPEGVVKAFERSLPWRRLRRNGEPIKWGLHLRTQAWELFVKKRKQLFLQMRGVHKQFEMGRESTRKGGKD